jgi:hypothetical protein
MRDSNAELKTPTTSRTLRPPPPPRVLAGAARLTVVTATWSWLQSKSRIGVAAAPCTPAASRATESSGPGVTVACARRRRCSASVFAAPPRIPSASHPSLSLRVLGVFGSPLWCESGLLNLVTVMYPSKVGFVCGACAP